MDSAMEPGSSDSEDSQDNMEEDEKELGNITMYKSLIEENDLNYEAHLGLIQALRKLGEFEELRKARQAMNQIYPLSPALWLEWLSDEQKICTTEEERKFIITLFKKAVKEYMSVQVWIEYILFMLGGGVVQDTRSVCEEALMAVGVHHAEGALIWQAVILAERQHFLSLDPKEEEAVEEQKKRIQNLYKRESRVPLMNIEKEPFLEEADKWFDEDIVPQLKRNLGESSKKSLEKIPFEESLLRASDDTEKLEAYRRYIDHVRSHDNPAVIQNVYERTVCDLCLNAGIWEEYVRFVMEQFSSASYIILPVCERSQLNCPWSSALFELHITALQKFEDTLGKEEVKKKISDALKKTLKVVMGTEAELIKVWMSYLVYLRRQIQWSGNTRDSDLNTFRESCDQAMAFIEEKLGEPADRECSIARFQARVEAESAKEIEVARSIWNEYIMKRNNNFKNAPLWIEFINLERSYGTEKHCRKLYRRALERVWDNVEAIGASFLQFEQELGTLESMMDFESRFRDRLSIVQKKRADDELKEEKKKKGKGDHAVKSKVIEDKNLGPNISTKTQNTKSQSPRQPKTIESSAQSTSPRGTKRKLPNDVSSPTESASSSQGDANKKQKVHGEFVEHDSSLDYRSVFLSNMDYNANEDEVLAVFDGCGEVESFRTAKDFRGRSKGFGYLIFKDPVSVPKALEKDRTPVGGRPLFVSRCNPTKKEPAFKFSTGLEKEKLFVKGLPFSMTQEEVKAAFEPHGDIKSFRLVTHRNGYSKGTCYIEYHDAVTAKKVLEKMDGTTLKEHTITVLISNPGAPKNKLDSSHPTSRQPVRPGNRQKTQLNLIPRSLQRSGTSGGSKQNDAPTSTKAESSNGISSKSNDDFRKMFLK